MKKLAILTLLVLAVSITAQTITVSFDLVPPNSNHSWNHTWTTGHNHLTADKIIVHIYEDGELLGTHEFQSHENTTSEITTLASEATELYTQLNAQEVVVNDLYDRIGTAMNDDQYQDKAYSQLTEDLVEDKKIYDEILYQVEVKMDEVRTEEGSGSLGWYYYN